MKKFYLTKKDKEDIRKANNFYELVIVGKRILSRMDQSIVQVCGPISTGGLGSIDKNIALLSNTIKNLSKKGVNVFNQLPFEKSFDRIMRNYKVEGYDTPILEEFYEPIFNSGKIKEVYFLPGWDKSIGACWEHNYAKKLGLKIVFL